MRGSWVFYARTIDGQIAEYHMTRGEAELTRDTVGSGNIIRMRINPPQRKLLMWNFLNIGAISIDDPNHVFGFQQI